MEMNELRLVALHGNVGSPRDWDALDLPRLHALNLWSRAGATMETYVDDLAKEWGGKGRAILLGYSLGGRLALMSLCRHPTAFAGAVILAAHPGLATGEAREARRLSDAAWAQRARELPWADFLSQWNAQSVFGSLPAPHRSDLEPFRSGIAEAFLQWSLGCQPDLREALAGIKIPMLWITGERDHAYTSLAQEITRAIPFGQHRIIAEAGHRLLSDAPGIVRQEIQEWLAEQFPLC
jgi:2-succinyl-6-hydroxy-2,4-cyclohexadiene-1-carboxylate synthase